MDSVTFASFFFQEMDILTVDQFDVMSPLPSTPPHDASPKNFLPVDDLSSFKADSQRNFLAAQLQLAPQALTKTTDLVQDDEPSPTNPPQIAPPSNIIPVDLVLPSNLLSEFTKADSIPTKELPSTCISDLIPPQNSEPANLVKSPSPSSLRPEVTKINSSPSNELQFTCSPDVTQRKVHNYVVLSKSVRHETAKAKLSSNPHIKKRNFMDQSSVDEGNSKSKGNPVTVNDVKSISKPGRGVDVTSNVSQDVKRYRPYRSKRHHSEKSNEFQANRQRQIFFHSGATLFLAIHGNSYTISNAVESISEDNNPNWRWQLKQDLQYLRVRVLNLVTYETQRVIKSVDFSRWKIIVRNLKNLEKIPICSFCKSINCTRWNVIRGGVQQIFHTVVEPIEH